MMRVNLIPAERRLARERRLRVRNWAVACAGYAMALAVVYACCFMSWHVGPDGLDAELAAVSAEAAELSRSLAAAESELSEAQDVLDSTRGIAKQPDWSLLLALLSKTLGDEVVLESCRLGPPTASAQPARVQRVQLPGSSSSTSSSAAVAAAARNDPPYALHLSGFARSQGAVSKFVLRLDELALFERVDLLKTSPEVLFDEGAVGFQVQCAFKWKGRTP